MMRKYGWILFVSLALVSIMVSCLNYSDTAGLFEGNPGIHHIPADLDLKPIIGGAPEAQFTTLSYENKIRQPSSAQLRRTYTSSIVLAGQEGPLVVTHTEFFMVQPNGSLSKQVADTDVGIPGIVTFIYLTTKHQSPHRIQFRKVVKRIENIDGWLFPLEKGNRLLFDMVMDYQASQGDTHHPVEELRWSYRFHVVDTYQGYDLKDGSLPGNIFVIEKLETGPEGSVEHTSIHYSESIGAAVKSIQKHENVIEEYRLVSMDSR